MKFLALLFVCFALAQEYKTRQKRHNGICRQETSDELIRDKLAKNSLAKDCLFV